MPQAAQWLLINRNSAHNPGSGHFVDCRQLPPYRIMEGLPVIQARTLRFLVEPHLHWANYRIGGPY